MQRLYVVTVLSVGQPVVSVFSTSALAEDYVNQRMQADDIVERRIRIQVDVKILDQAD